MTKALAALLHALARLLTAPLGRWRRLTVLARLHDRVAPVAEAEVRGVTVKFLTPDRSAVYWPRHGYGSEPGTLDWLDSLGADDLLYDIGANVGAYALYAGVGLACVLWRFPADVAPSVVSSALAALRAAIATAVGKAPADAYVVVEDAPPNIRSHLDIWGPAPETMRLMQQLKAQWDPAGVLNPGRYLL